MVFLTIDVFLLSANALSFECLEQDLVNLTGNLFKSLMRFY